MLRLSIDGDLPLIHRGSDLEIEKEAHGGTFDHIALRLDYSGVSPSGKATGSDPVIRGFKSSHPSHRFNRGTFSP